MPLRQSTKDRQSTRETEDESSGWLSSIRGSSEERSRDEYESTEPRSADESRSWFGRARAKYGLGALLVVAGIGLFLFPEPVTSTAGIALIVLGAITWFVGWLR